MAHTTPYTETFRQLQPQYDPRHIEAFVRVHFSTLDHLSKGEMRRQAKIAAQCVDAIGKEKSELIAQSFGL